MGLVVGISLFVLGGTKGFVYGVVGFFFEDGLKFDGQEKKKLLSGIVKLFVETVWWLCGNTIVVLIEIVLPRNCGTQTQRSRG